MSEEAVRSRTLIGNVVTFLAKAKTGSVHSYMEQAGIRNFMDDSKRGKPIKTFLAKPSMIKKITTLIPELTPEDFTSTHVLKGGARLVLTEEGRAKCFSIIQSLDKPSEKRKKPVKRTNSIAPVIVQSNIPIQVLGDLIAIAKDEGMNRRLLRVLDYLEPMKISLGEILRAAVVQAGHS